MKNSIYIALMVLVAFCQYNAEAIEVRVTLDGGDATGVYSEDGGVDTAFEGKIKTDAGKVEVKLKKSETRRLGEKFETGSTDLALKKHGMFTNSVASSLLQLSPPDKSEWKTNVPKPYWEGHDDVVKCFAHALEVTGREYLHDPEPGSGFTRRFVYTPFGSSVFMWGNCYITMWGRYASHLFEFIDMLDNFYGKQSRDGFIPRQIDIRNGQSTFEKNDLSGSGGNLLAWAEWRNYEWTGETNRLSKAYPSLLAFHRWLRTNRTWKDGTYFSSGWGCGMDNIPRFKGDVAHSHGHISYVDVTLQQAFNAKLLLKIAEVLKTDEGVIELKKEYRKLERIANKRMWDEAAGVYKDLDADGNRVSCSHIGTYWALLAGIANSNRVEKLADNALDPKRFAAACGLASTSIDDPEFVADGGNYWAGGCWCIMDYSAAKGFESVGRADIAHVIARRAVEAVAQVYTQTGAIWESYSPTEKAPGKNWGHRVRKFIGFSGTVPVALFIENVLGVQVEGPHRIVWDIRLKESHGIENLVLADGNRVSLRYDAATDKATWTSERPVEVIIKKNHR